MEQAKSLYTCILTHKTTSNMCTFIFPLHISHTTQYNTPIQRLSVLSVAHTPNTSQHWRAWIDRERKPASGARVGEAIQTPTRMLQYCTDNMHTRPLSPGGHPSLCGGTPCGPTARCMGVILKFT